ncbi:zinc finger protein 578-like [Ylistrum balloti]|uniref:zinc finger protein 578-like n=1 Tax=Ylistrum balloti TaxID=509963 RepID=UPI0029058C00|nr:zinc finger protein 578-like [Ylistrum balloti]
MAEKPSKEQDILELFKSKVAEAVGMVALIPDAQKRQLHDFWDVISNTINPSNKSADIDRKKTEDASVNISEKFGDRHQFNEDEASNNSQKECEGADEIKNDEASHSIQEGCEDADEGKSDDPSFNIQEECLPSDDSRQQIQANQNTTNEESVLVSSDIQDFFDMVSTSNQVSYSESPVTSTLSSQNLSVAQYCPPDDMHSQFTGTNQQDVRFEVDTHNSFDETSSNAEYLQNRNDIVEIEAVPAAPTKESMVSMLKKEITVPTEILCEVREDSQTIEIHLPQDFAEGEILTPEKLSMLLQGQFQSYSSPVKAEPSNIHQFVDNISVNSSPTAENVSKQDNKDAPHEQTVPKSSRSNKNDYSDEVLHEIQDNQFPKADSHIVPNYDEHSESNKSKKKRKHLRTSSPGRTSKRIKQRKDNINLEGDILTPEKVLDYLYGEDIDKEIDGKDIDNNDADEEQAVRTSRKRRRRNRLSKPETSSNSEPRKRQHAQNRPREERNKLGNIELVWECKTCGIKLSNSGALHVHQRKHTGARPFSCKECDKTFTTKQNMKRHELSHTGEKPFSCDLCEKSFTEKKSLIIHNRTHTGEKPYVCEICSRGFTQSVTLKTHMMVHTGDKKHLCELCGKSFKQRANLLSHKKRHLEEKTYNCSDCSFSFFTKGELDRHILRHTGEKPFQCDICPKRFTRQQYLNEHLNIHIGNKPYSCNKCEEKFHDQSTYHRHLKKHKPKKEDVVKEEVILETLSTEDPKETTTYVMETNSLLGQDALEQLQAVINNEVEKIQHQSGTSQPYQTVILKGSSAQPVETLEEGTKNTAVVKDGVSDQVYQITMVDQSQEVVATVDFSAFNLLANATAKQYAISSE